VSVGIAAAPRAWPRQLAFSALRHPLFTLQ